MHSLRPTGRGASSRKYDILTALGAFALRGSKHEQRRMLRFMLLITARYNWRRDRLSVGQREIAMMWSCDERTVKREMARLKAKRQKSHTMEKPGGIQRLFFGGEVNYPLSYYRAVADLCAEHGTQLIFLYLPFYGAGADSPRMIAEFEELAPVWLAPKEIFGDPDLHFDHSHLNQKGAQLYTKWLRPKVADLLRN